MPSPVRRIQEGLSRAVAQADSVEAVQTAAASVLVPRFDVALTVWSTLDPADLLGTSCRLFDRDLAALPVGPAELVRERALFELEWLDTDPNTFASLRRSGRVAAGLRADVGDPSSVMRYNELLAPLGVFDELRVVLRDGDDVWGSAILYRDNAPFTPDEVATVAACAPVLARALRRCLLVGAAEHAALDSPPGTLVLDDHDHVVITSPAAEQLLAGLDDQHVRTALVSVAAGARINGDVCTTVIGRDRVIALHAAPAKGLEGGVTVVVESPRPSQLAPLILRALGFTAREREVAECLLQGLTRRMIAQRCHITEDTVDDHLKRIYDKADVSGRAGLSALLFERFYRPHRYRDAPSPYGWFLVDDE